MRKILALALALIMVLTAAAAFAESTGLTITIEDTNKEQVYKIYKLFDATVTAQHQTGGEGISYQLMEGKTLPEDNTWFQVDLAGNVTAKDGIEEKDIITDAFRTWAEGYGTLIETVEGNGEDKAITGLSDGYYFITTTTGTLVTVTSVGPNVEVKDKNPGTTIDKKIISAETGSVESDGEKALAQVGSSVVFESRIPIKEGALNYIFKDNMSAGLTCNKDVKVFLVDAGGAVEESTAEVDQTVCGAPTYPESGDYDIVLPFENAWVKANKGKDIVIRYSATVNADAVIAGNGNPNTARIEWGNTEAEEPLFKEDNAVVYTAQISVTKYEGSATSEDAKFLGGAGFRLKNADGKYYKLDNGKVTWVEGETNGDEHLSAETDGKMPPFIGLADGVYTLVETTVPQGFNKASDTTVTIKEQDFDAENLDQTATVENRKGAELPSTGGIGTTIFYVIGGLLVLVAAIILVTRRKAESK